MADWGRVRFSGCANTRPAVFCTLHRSAVFAELVLISSLFGQSVNNLARAQELAKAEQSLKEQYEIIAKLSTNVMSARTKTISMLGMRRPARLTRSPMIENQNAPSAMKRRPGGMFAGKLEGESDEMVIDLNERARDHMRAETRLVIVPRATHLFEEPGALEEVARLARDWFSQRLASSAHSSSAA